MNSTETFSGLLNTLDVAEAKDGQLTHNDVESASPLDNPYTPSDQSECVSLMVGMAS
jgi:hypothetical protein